MANGLLRAQSADVLFSTAPVGSGLFLRVERRSVKPVLQALVVADRVYQDRATGKVLICGTFHKVLFGKTPPVFDVQTQEGRKQTLLAGGMDAGAPSAYISITDAASNTELLLQFTNLTTNRTIFGTKLRVESHDRLQTIEIVAPLPRLPISEAGTYAIEVLCEGELLGSHRIVAEESILSNPPLPLPPPPTES